MRVHADVCDRLRREFEFELMRAVGCLRLVFIAAPQTDDDPGLRRAACQS
jgi:hypothetical protein